MREVLKSVYISLMSNFKALSNEVHILNGHFISRNHSDICSFQMLIEELAKNAILINVEDAVQLIEEKKKVNRPHIAFTFDDGFEECYSMIAPVLNDHKVNAAFFIIPNYVDGNSDYVKNLNEKVLLTPGKVPMNWSQIIELHTHGHIIGSHTLDHFRLNSVNENEIQKQINLAKQIIEKKIDSNCNYFAYPFGQQSDISEFALDVACKYHKYVFTGSNYSNYYSFNNKAYNRRHFEGDWSHKHVKYFLSSERSY